MPARQRSRRGPQRGGRARWAAWIVAIAAALAAAWALSHGGGGPGAPLDDVDAASRAELERVLREAEEGRR